MHDGVRRYSRCHTVGADLLFALLAWRGVSVLVSVDPWVVVQQGLFLGLLSSVVALFAFARTVEYWVRDALPCSRRSPRRLPCSRAFLPRAKFRRRCNFWGWLSFRRACSWYPSPAAAPEERPHRLDAEIGDFNLRTICGDYTSGCG